MSKRSRQKQGAPNKAQRLSAALRENLRRRKAQAKGRKAATGPSRHDLAVGRLSAGSTETNATMPHDSAGIADKK